MLRATGMSLPVIRRYTDLVKQGDGNEKDRVALLRQHEQHVSDQIAQLNRCLDMIHYKLTCYEDILSEPTSAASRELPGWVGLDEGGDGLG
jgi:DNA-binding transcriptional MerR regulator